MPVPPIELRELDINVSNLCNLECPHCSFSSTRSKDEPFLPGPLIHRILDEAHALGNKAVHWSGGEPTMRKDLPELIAHGVELGYAMRVLSNGILLSERRLQEFWDHGLRKMFVSLDGFEENHDFHRGSAGLFPKTMAGIRNSIRMGYDVRVNAYGTIKNVDDIPLMVPMLAEEGVNTFTIFYLIPVGRGADMMDLVVPPLRWRQLIEEVREAAGKLPPGKMAVTVEKVFWWDDEWEEGIESEGRGGGCLGFLNKCDYLEIMSTGRVYPCVCFVDHGPPLGNLHEESLSDILNDPSRWDFYWGLKELSEPCRSCAMVGACGGGSPADSRALLGDWKLLDPRCSGDPVAQRFVPLCYSLREDVTSHSRSGFAEAVDMVGPPQGE